jgi:hypothetical protein
MPMWRCPHCGTPQAETARCWVCHRSSTACATCRHFRRSVAAQLGYCGLDRQRKPLRGDEIRACWEAGAGAAESASTAGARLPVVRADDPDDRTPVRRLEFVEVRSTPVAAHPAAERRRTRRAKGAAPVIAGADDPASVSPGPGVAAASATPSWSLWGDVET